MTVVDLIEKLATEEVVCFNAHYSTPCGIADNATHTFNLSFAIMNFILIHFKLVNTLVSL